MFDLMIGIEGVQRRTRQAFNGEPRAPKRRVAAVRLSAAAAPIRGDGRPSLRARRFVQAMRALV